MDDTTTDREVQAFDLIDSLDQQWFKLPLAVMQDVGPAAQTLGGFLKITNRETFVATRDIAEAARAPLATVRKHLETLSEHGWIENKGRGRTHSGRPRRTATRMLTPKCKKSLEPYAILPWWACSFICGTNGGRNTGRLRWSTKAVLSIVMSRLGSLKAAAECDGGDDIIDWIECYGAEEQRFRFSLSYLERQTGLTREAVVSAKRDLHGLGIVEWADSDSGIDCIRPRWDFRVVKTPADPGFFRVSFRNTEG